MATCSWLLTSLVDGGGLLGVRADKGFDLSAEHLRERRTEDNILLLGKLDIKSALN